MRVIRFKAEGQRLYRSDGGGMPASGSRGYLRARFELGPGWDGMDLYARFFDMDGREHAAKLDGGECAVPDEVTGGRAWRVSLAGVDGARTATTNKVTVVQEV